MVATPMCQSTYSFLNWLQIISGAKDIGLQPIDIVDVEENHLSAAASLLWGPGQCQGHHLLRSHHKVRLVYVETFLVGESLDDHFLFVVSRVLHQQYSGFGPADDNLPKADPGRLGEVGEDQSLHIIDAASLAATLHHPQWWFLNSNIQLGGRGRFKPRAPS